MVHSPHSQPLLADAGDGDVVIRDQKVHLAKFPQTIMNILRGFIGAGLLGVPFSFSQSGWLAGVIAFVLLAFPSLHSMILLIASYKRLFAQHPECDDFGDVVRIAFGRKGKLFTDVCLVFTQTGFSTAYFIFLGVNLRRVVLDLNGTDLGVIPCILPGLAITLPLVMFRSLRHLSFISTLGNIALLYGVLVVLYYDGSKLRDSGISHSISQFNPATFLVFFGQSVYIYEGIGLIVPIYKSMENPKQFRSAFWICMSFFICLVCSFGLMGYFPYGADTCQIIINNSGSSVVAQLVRVVYALCLLFSYPLQMFPVFQITEASLGKRLPKGDVHSMLVPPKTMVWRTILVLITIAIAIVSRNLFGYFIALIGSVAGSALLFIIPPWCHLQVFKNELTTWVKVKDYAIMAFGIIGGIASLVVTILSIVQDSSHTC